MECFLDYVILHSNINYMKKLLIIVAALAFLGSCKTAVKGKNGVEYHNATEYNQYIVERQQKIMEYVLKMVDDFKIGNYEGASHIIDECIPAIDKAASEVEGMPAWKDDTELRDNMLNLFKFYKKAFGTDYKRMIEIKKQSTPPTPDEQRELEEMVNRITTEENTLDRKFRNSQTEFANKNNMKILENDLQKKIDKMK